MGRSRAHSVGQARRYFFRVALSGRKRMHNADENMTQYRRKSSVGFQSQLGEASGSLLLPRRLRSCLPYGGAMGGRWGGSYLAAAPTHNE